jgi:hypothetical protein
MVVEAVVGFEPTNPHPMDPPPALQLVNLFYFALASSRGKDRDQLDGVIYCQTSSTWAGNWQYFAIKQSD